MYRHILIATDGSEVSSRAVEHGVALARSVGAQLSFLTVTVPFHVFSLEADQLEDTRFEYEVHMRKRAERILSSASAGAARSEISFEKIHREDDQPSETIIRVADAQGCDLIIMGSHGRRAVSALLLGSTTMKVLAQAKKPVLVVR